MPNSDIPANEPQPESIEPIAAKPAAEPVGEPIPAVEVRPPLPKNYYFDNYKVEALLTEYVKNGCTDVRLRDEIMLNAGELIRQIIRTHNLQNIYPGRDEAAFGDLFQIAWCQLEKTLYKFDYGPGHTKVFNMWCVRPDTNIYVNGGIDTIENVVKRVDYSDDQVLETLGPDGTRGIVAGVKKDKRKVIDITTELGYELGCTPEHKIMVLGEDGPEWKLAGDLTLGDLVGIQYNTGYFGFCDRIDDIGELTFGGDWAPPKVMTPELAYILGLYIAEGSHSYGKLVIYNIDEDVIERCCNNTLGLNFIHEPQFQRVSLCNRRFIEFIGLLGFPKSRAWEKTIPTRMLRLSHKNVVSLLSGMFDGDGHSSKHNGIVGYTSTSKRLLNQVRMILLNLGMLTKLSTDNRKESTFTNKEGMKVTRSRHTAYQLQLSTAHSKRFYDLVGFNINRKQAKREALKPERQLMYGVGSKFKSLYARYGAGELGYNSVRTVIIDRAFCSVDTAQEKMQSWSEYSDDPNYLFIEERINEFSTSGIRTVWLPIVSLTDSMSEVCEISVDSPDCAYIANGIISHNSQVARTVMLAHIKKESRDRRGKSALETHILTKPTTRPVLIERFLKEAREICKYNDEYLELLDHIEEIHETDDRAYEGLIGKLIKKSGRSRQKISNFLLFIRFRGVEFSDSPMNDQVTQRPLPNWEHNDE